MSKTIASQYRYKSKTIQKKDLKILFFSIFGFFIGRGIIFTFISPFAIPFLALFLGQSMLNFFIVYLSVIFGLYESFSGIFFYTYFIGATILLICNFLILKNEKFNNIFYNSSFGNNAVSGVSILLCGLIPFFFYGHSLYFSFCFCFLGLYSFVLPQILSKGFTIFKFTGTLKPLTMEEIVSLSVLLSGFILGSSNIKFAFFNLNIFSIILIILILSFSSGSSAACTGAIALCFIPFISKSIDPRFYCFFCNFRNICRPFKK